MQMPNFDLKLKLNYDSNTKAIYVTLLVITCGNSASATLKDFTWREWWKPTVIYQIYPLSYMDSNGDGIGDLQGIINSIDHLSDIGIETIWITPIYESPMKDFGYDISNFTEIDPVFGTIATFDALVSKLHSRGMRLIMDFVPNHTSDQHIWFQESKKNNYSCNPYRDYYVWKDSKPGCRPSDIDNDDDRFNEKCVPNNWVSRFGGPAWTWCPERRQYYLHQFLKEQPDLNYRHPHVQEEMKDILRFWFDRDVDGCRVDSIKFLFESNTFADEPINPDFISPPNHQARYNSLIHTETSDLPDVHKIVRDWRATVFDKYSINPMYRFMGTQSYGDATTLSLYYGSDDSPEADFPFNFQFIKLTPQSLTGNFVYELVDDWMTNTPSGKWTNWVFSHHGKDRIANRFGKRNQRAGLMLNILLPGTPHVYYGEEIGMENIEVSYEDIQDPWGKNNPCCWKELNRDKVRSPMQWNTRANAGFSDAEKIWLPVNNNYRQGVNVQEQQEDSFSTLTFFKKLLKVRKTSPALLTTTLTYSFVSEEIFSFIRSPDDEEGGQSSSSFLIAINFSNRTVCADYTKNLATNTIVKYNNQLGIVAISSNMDRDEEVVDLRRLQLNPGEALAIKTSVLIKNEL